MIIIIPVLIVILDQISKKLIDSSMILYESQTIIPKLLDLTYIHNDGAAFSILEGKQTLLIASTFLLMFVILAYLIVYRDTVAKLEKFALLLVLGGGIGNLIDRVMYGYVIDFLNIHIIPIFNIADIAITVGCILFAVSVFLPHKK